MYDPMLQTGCAVFGDNWIFAIDFGIHAIWQNSNDGDEIYDNYEAYKHGHKYLTGDNRYEKCTPLIEVFQINTE